MDQSESRLRIEFPALVSIQTYLKNLNQILDLMELRDAGVLFRSQSIFKFSVTAGPRIIQPRSLGDRFRPSLFSRRVSSVSRACKNNKSSKLLLLGSSVSSLLAFLSGNGYFMVQLEKLATSILMTDKRDSLH